MPSILFVCSANQCRSPMAEVLFKDLLEEQGDLGRWRVESAGIWAYSGSQATQNAQQVMGEIGLDLSTFRSQPATNELLTQFDLIIVMTQDHRDALLDADPSLQGKVFLLRELGGESGDFADPVGGSVPIYRRAGDEIRNLLAKAYTRLDSLLNS